MGPLHFLLDQSSPRDLQIFTWLIGFSHMRLSLLLSKGIISSHSIASISYFSALLYLYCLLLSCLSVYCLSCSIRMYVIWWQGFLFCDWCILSRTKYLLSEWMMNRGEKTQLCMLWVASKVYRMRALLCLVNLLSRSFRRVSTHFFKS